MTITTQRNRTYPIRTSLVVWECPVCGIVYGIPESFANDKRSNGGHYFCPSGHSLSWNESDAERERKARVAAESRAAQAEETARRQRERAEAVERSNTALRGHLTRIRKRMAAGVCPVAGCRRSGFLQVRKHIAAKHPEWLAEHVHDIDGA